MQIKLTNHILQHEVRASNENGQRMNGHGMFLSASFALGLVVVNSDVGSAQAGAKPAAAPSTWVQYVADLRPNLEQGQWGPTIDSKFWDKYDGMAVQWAGTLK